MQFIKQKFMGIELDILTGHPEHDIFFVATQAAKASGVKCPKWATQNNKMAKGTMQGRDLEALVGNSPTLDTLKATGPRWRDSWLFPESVVYTMLLRGHAPASEPFRKWVTEEVLPSIRKTGQYNVNESTTETGQQFFGELCKVVLSCVDSTLILSGIIWRNCMNIKALCLVMLTAVLAGCASHSSNLQVGNELSYTSLKEYRDAVKTVKVYDSLPKGAEILGEVSASRCHRNSLHEPPREESVVADLQVSAYVNGADGITGVSIKKASALSSNCWHVLNGTAIAFTQPSN